MTNAEYLSKHDKELLRLFSAYDSIVSRISDMDFYDDIRALQFNSHLNEFTGRIQSGEPGNPVERIVLKREKRDELIYTKVILDRAIYVASGHARVKDRKRIRRLLRDNLINRIPREYLDIPISSNTLAKYRRIAIDYVKFTLSFIDTYTKNT